MKPIDLIEPMFLRAMDHVASRAAQPLPSKKRLESVTLFSHRGEHDNSTILENTTVAFRRALESGVRGIEFDVRWTKDLIPVVFHDATLKRIYNDSRLLSDFSMAQLQRNYPDIPTLAEVVKTFGKRLHLMIELKWEPLPHPNGQRHRLAQELKHLMPGKEFHLMSLTPQLFNTFNNFPQNAYLPIARIHSKAMSQLSINQRFGGLTGHYVFITKQMIKSHHEIRQRVGTGFVSSRNSLYRELNRGVDWIFSNNAAVLQKIVNDLVDSDKLSI